MKPLPARAAISAVALVEPTHQGYREHTRRACLHHGGIRRDTTPDPMGAWSTAAEGLIRDHLQREFPLSRRRIMTYQEHHSRGAARHYRELDAVAVGEAKALTVFEIKASVQGKLLRAGHRQLRLAALILGTTYRHVRCVLVVTPPPWALPEEVANWPDCYLQSQPKLRPFGAPEPGDGADIELLWVPPTALAFPLYVPSPEPPPPSPDG